MGNIGPTQLLILLAIVALIFGTKKLRGMGSDLGGAVKGFKKAMKEGEDQEMQAQAQPEQVSQEDDAKTVDVEARETTKDRT